MTEIALWEDVWDVINEEFTLLRPRSSRPHPTRGGSLITSTTSTGR